MNPNRRRCLSTTADSTPSAGLPESVRDPITHRFIGHAMKVHSLVGPGLNEEIYHQELVAALTAAGIPQSRWPLPERNRPRLSADHLERSGQCRDSIRGSQNPDQSNRHGPLSSRRRDVKFRHQRHPRRAGPSLNDGINATDRAILQTHLRWLKLDWGIVFHFGKTTADLSFVRRPFHANTFSPADSGRPTD